jgi:hypothetical protein
LQRMLDDEVFGRAYGLALPASIGGIALGSLIAPVLVSVFGETAALFACGAVVTGYCAVLWRARPTETTMQAAAAPLPGAPTVPVPGERPRAWRQSMNSFGIIDRNFHSERVRAPPIPPYLP